MPSQVIPNATQRISADVLQSAGANTTFSQVLSAYALNTTTGRSLLFAHSGDAYVFVQGGSTDLVAKFEAGVAHSAQDLAHCSCRWSIRYQTFHLI